MQSDSVPILILAARDDLSYLLINHLARRFSIAQVVFEAPHTRKMLRYRLKKLGAWKVAGDGAGGAGWGDVSFVVSPLQSGDE